MIAQTPLFTGVLKKWKSRKVTGDFAKFDLSRENHGKIGQNSREMIIFALNNKNFLGGLSEVWHKLSLDYQVKSKKKLAEAR